MAELKPCLFCGENLILKHYNSGSYYEHPDNNCFLASADSEYGSVWISKKDKSGIEAWNTRTPKGTHDERTITQQKKER